MALDERLLQGNTVFAVEKVRDDNPNEEDRQELEREILQLEHVNDQIKSYLSVSNVGISQMDIEKSSS